MPRTVDDTTSALIDGQKVCAFCYQREGNEHMCRCPWYLATVLNGRTT